MIHLDDPANIRSMKRSRELVDLIGHVLAYVLVNTALVLIDLIDGAAGSSVLGLNWAYWPIIGWGAALACHAAVVFFSLHGLKQDEQRSGAHHVHQERPLERV